MKQKNKYLSAVALVIYLIANSSWSQDKGDGSSKKANFSFGIAYTSGASVYVGSKSKSRLVPYLSYESEKIRINLQEGLTYKTLKRPNYSLDVSFAPNFRPYKSVDSVALSEMRRDMTLDGSVSASYEIARGLDAKLETGTELTKKFNGQKVDLSLSQFIPLFGIPVIFKGGATWYDKNRAQYFYGVYENEATVERPTYDVGSIVIPYLSVNAFYSLKGNMTIFANLNTKIFPLKISNSPIVDTTSSLGMVVGIGYTF